MTKYSNHGIDISAPEILNISINGFWLLIATEELFVPFQKFPWFLNATVKQICNLQWPTQDHLYWSDLDIDLSLESIRNPDVFPLVSNPKNSTRLMVFPLALNPCRTQYHHRCCSLSLSVHPALVREL